MLENIKKLSIALFISFLLNIWGAVLASGADQSLQGRGVKRTVACIGSEGRRSAFVRYTDYSDYISALAGGSLQDVLVAYENIHSHSPSLAPYSSLINKNPLLQVLFSSHAERDDIAQWLIAQAYEDSCKKEDSKEESFNPNRFIQLFRIQELAGKLPMDKVNKLKELIKQSLRESDMFKLQESAFSEIFIDPVSLCLELEFMQGLPEKEYDSYEWKYHTILLRYVEKILIDIEHDASLKDKKKKEWLQFFAMNSEERSFLDYVNYFNWGDIKEKLVTLAHL